MTNAISTSTTSTSEFTPALRIGVLAIQGGFHEHLVMLRQVRPDIEAVEVRSKADIEDPRLDGLIIPGGESTTMSIVAQRSGAWSALQELVRNRPVWGTCAGMILLSSEAHNQKQDGQALLGALPITVYRNRFGSQVESFEATLSEPKAVLCATGSTADEAKGFPALFIRAPVVEAVGEDVQVLTRVERVPGKPAEVVAVRYRDILACAFHPELTGDNRWHHYFVRMVIEARMKRHELS
ncbi:PdxT/SNO family [Syncephalis plumigaleata]|nr:PdxT/SNO family [Syncephalis plumigaleata]